MMENENQYTLYEPTRINANYDKISSYIVIYESLCYLFCYLLLVMMEHS